MSRSEGELDVFSRGLPPIEQFKHGFQSRFPDVEMSKEAMESTLRGIDIRPNTLQQNLRANLFPDTIESVVFSLKSTLYDQNLYQLSEYEDIHRKLHNQTNTSAVVTRVEPSDITESIIPYGLFHPRDATLIGSELWNVEVQPSLSMDKSTLYTSKYRVNYYTSMGGDFFYTDMLPSADASPKQWMGFAWLRAKRFTKNIMGTLFGEDQQGQETTKTLPQPKSRPM